MKNIQKFDKKSNQKMAKIGLLVGIVAILGLFIWAVYLPKTNSPSAEGRPKEIFVVEKGAGLQEIAENLTKKELIRASWLFQFYALLTAQNSHLKAGSYYLSQNQSIADILSDISKGNIAKETITVLEGWAIKDIAKILGEKDIVSAEDFLSQASQPKSNQFANYYVFLEEAPQQSGLEGYLFPDTYHIAIGSTSQEIIEQMLNNFRLKITGQIKEKISQQKKTLFKIIVMASILEKEVKTLEDKKIVAGILWKRLEAGWPLQADATISYLTNKQGQAITKNDLAIDSPYNTYKYPGLPLGPICNPGLESILATLDYQESPYWFYLSGQEGQTIFSKTLAEHNKAVAEHLK